MQRAGRPAVATLPMMAETLSAIFPLPATAAGGAGFDAGECMGLVAEAESRSSVSAAHLLCLLSEMGGLRCSRVSVLCSKTSVSPGRPLTSKK